MFADTLLQWFDTHKRDLPWRGETDPYRIWVSEIILQQTRVAQGIDYYRRFLEAFPDVAALARADEAAVLKVWQGLGYYSRARNMHAAARSIMDEHGGRFPADYAGIRQLKGVGDYTAAAIGSIAFGLPHPAVDGNVLRFVARYQGIFDNIAADTTRRQIADLCGQWLATDRAGAFNQAMMEMGATLCTPKSPDCSHCPFADQCYAHLHEQTEQLPFKSLNVKVKERFFHYLVPLFQEQTILQRRSHDDIWKNLYEFPLVEQESEHFEINIYLKNNHIETSAPPQRFWQTKHVLTHRNIYAYFYLVPVKRLPKPTADQMVVKISELKNYAVAKVTERAIDILLGDDSTAQLQLDFNPKNPSRPC
jgi:A/G-specific adenine glycosylase